MPDTKIAPRHIAALPPWSRNARTQLKKQVQQIADSIRKFGFTYPVLIDEAGTILAGHGRVWQLGAHRLICGDALDPNVVATLIAGEQTRMIFIDPPYNVPIYGHVGGSGKTKHRVRWQAYAKDDAEQLVGGGPVDAQCPEAAE